MAATDNAAVRGLAERLFGHSWQPGEAQPRPARAAFSFHGRAGLSLAGHPRPAASRFGGRSA